MFAFLPAEVRAGLERARKRAPARSRRLSLHLGDAVFPILRIWDDGFAIDAERMTKLRGYVEIHEGSRPILTCLILAAEVADGQLICTYKWSAPVRDSAALDYELDEDRPRLRLPPQ